MSTCTKSKQELETWTEDWNGNLFCLAIGQIAQSKDLLLPQLITSGIRDCKMANLWKEGCPNLLCQRLVLSITEVKLLEFTEFTKLKEKSLDSISEIDLGRTMFASSNV